MFPVTLLIPELFSWVLIFSIIIAIIIIIIVVVGVIMCKVT